VSRFAEILRNFHFINYDQSIPSLETGAAIHYEIMLGLLTKFSAKSPTGWIFGIFYLKALLRIYGRSWARNHHDSQE